MPVAMLEREVKAIVPAFWAKYKKHVKTFTKSSLLKPAKTNDTWQTNFGKFLGLVSSISDGKSANTISSKRRAKQLEKATKFDLLSEFIKVDESDWLVKRWVMKKAETEEVKISFRLTRAIDPNAEDGEDEEGW